MMAEMDESQLVGAAQSGDREAFSALVRLHQARLRALVAMAMLPPDDVNDIVQDAFVDAFRHLDRFERGRAFGPWLRTICRNRLHNFLRDRAVRRRRELDGLEELLPAPADEEVDGVLDHLDGLRACLAGLTDRQRRTLRLRFHDGLAVKDVATRLGTSANAVSVLLGHLRSELLRCIAGRERLGGGAS